jgi:predicted DNA-binding transcriptional regulator YafY
MAKGEMVTRWLNLFMAIQGGRPHTPDELARRTGVSTRTVYRDLKGLQDAGFPIYFDPDKRTYRVTDGFQLRPLHFTPDELADLVGALNFVRRTGPLRSRKSADQLLDRLLAGMPQGQRDAVGDLDRKLVIDPLGARSLEDEQISAALQQALADRRKVRMTYAAFAHGGQEEERTVRPYGLAYRGTSLYLIAHCDLRGGIRTFRVGRIKQIAVTAQPYIIPDDFDLDQYLTGLWGITEGPETQVRLRFSPAVAQLAVETIWHPTQQNAPQPDGSVIVAMTTRGPAELSRWIAGYGGHVIVLEPPALRKAVGDLARGIIEAHAQE